MPDRKTTAIATAALLLTAAAISTAAAAGDESRPRLMPQLGHDQRVVSVAFSPTGEQILTGGSDAAAVLWDIATGREVRRFEIDRNAVWSVAFAAGGDQVLVGSWDATLFDVHSGEKIRSFEPDGLASAMAVSPDGTQLLITATNDASLWDLETGKRLQRYVGNRSAIGSVAFSPDGKQVATGGGYNPTMETRDIKDFTVRLWDAASGEELRQFVGHAGAVSAVSFSPDGRYLLSASRDEPTSRIWDVATGQEVTRIEGSTGERAGAAFSPDGRHLVTSSWPITLWDLEGNKVREFEGHESEVAALAFSPDGKQLASASWDMTARLWDVETCTQLQLFEGKTYALSTVAFSGSGRWIATAGSDNKGHLWDARTGAEVQRFEGHGPGQYGYLDIYAVAISNDEQTVLTGGYDGTARLWNAHTGEQKQVLSGHGKDDNGYYQVQAVAFSADGRQVLTGGADGSARLWDAETGDQLVVFEGHGKSEYGSSGVRPVAFLGDGRVLTGGEDGTARIWDAESGAELRRFEGWSEDIRAFSPDGLRAMTQEGLWNLEKGAAVWSINDNHPAISAVFSTDGRRVLTTSGSNVSDKTARLWDAATGTELHRFVGHTASLSGGAISADGGLVATVSRDRTTRIWDTGSGRELVRLISFDDGTWAAVDAAGRFDASFGGEIDGLHWVAGLEPIALSQLKERYYEPALLAKVLGFNDEKPRPVEQFNERGIDLFPSLVVTREPTAADPLLRLQLTNRGGGIGRIQVLLNGKEVREDARSPGADAEAESLEVEVDLAGSPLLIPGTRNIVELVAYNASGYLASPARRLEIAAPASAWRPVHAGVRWEHGTGAGRFGAGRRSVRLSRQEDRPQVRRQGRQRLRHRAGDRRRRPPGAGRRPHPAADRRLTGRDPGDAQEHRRGVPMAAAGQADRHPGGLSGRPWHHLGRRLLLSAQGATSLELKDDAVRAGRRRDPRAAS